MEEIEEAADLGRRHARRAVVSIVGFWLGGALAPLDPSASGFFIAWLFGMACGLMFFYTVSAIAAAGTPWRPLDFWNGPRVGKAPAADKRQMTNALLRPSWWARVVNNTAWPRALVWLALATSLAAALLRVGQRFELVLRNF